MIRGSAVLCSMLRAILFLLLPVSLLAQSLSGSWEGDLLVDENETNYQATLKLLELEGSIEGSFFLVGNMIPNDLSENWSGSYRVEGKVEANILSLQLFPEYRQTSGANCLAKLDLDLDANNKILQGKSDGEPYAAMNCLQAQVKLEQKKANDDVVVRDTLVGEIKGRWIKKGTAITVPEKFKIRIFDHLEVDGDVVSFYFNKKRVIRKHHLDAKPFELELQMDTNLEVNHLVVLSHNTGQFYPNTVAVEVLAGEQKQVFILNSDKEHSDIIYFHLDK